jgi:predicted membrane protein
MLTLALVLTWFPRVRQSIKLISLTSLIALFGVYMMRYNIVIGPQMQPKISQGLISYAPVVFGAGSWQVVFGLFMLPLFVLAVLSMVLPWDDHIFSIRIAVANEKRQPDQNNFRELT